MRGGTRWTMVLALLAALPVLYLASYFALVRHGSGFGNGGVMSWTADYRLFPEAARRLFVPLQQLDRKWLRPTYWEQKDRLRLTPD